MAERLDWRLNSRFQDRVQTPNPESEPAEAASATSVVTIVIPCLNEESMVGEVLSRLDEMSAHVADVAFEFIFVDDGSTDRTAALLRAASRDDPRLRIIRFSRNFGQQIAVSAGLDVARGDAVVLMDCDLQDPPELVPDMVAKWREGFDVVYGTRRSRRADSWFKRVSARAFYLLMTRLSEIEIPSDTGDFRLMSRRIVDVLCQMPERHRFLRGMVAWTGFRQTSIPYDRPDRFAGTTKYPLGKMIRYALDGLLSFSTRPLQLCIALGLMSAGLALAGICYALAMRLFTSVWVEGWTALMIAVLFLGGVQLLSLGIIGEYIGRIYGEVQRRPLYVVREMIGFGQEVDRVDAGQTGS